MSAAPSGRRPATIGAVLADLAGEFPDVTISKIRFLESEGLIEPARTPAGYRAYTGDDVERLRYILRAQRDNFWPLKVIRESLDALDRGLRPPEAGASTSRPVAPDASPDPDVPAVGQLRPAAPIRLTLEELAGASGLDPSVVSSLESYGLVTPDRGGWYGEPDLQVAAAAAGLAAYGIEPRHLRPFRTSADREVGLVEQALAGRTSAGARAPQAAEVAHLCLRLHAALVKGGLARG